MDLEHVNHVAAPGVLPIAFSLVHQVLIEDGSIVFAGGPTPQFNDDWAERIGLAISDHGKERTVEEMMNQRIGDYAAFREFQRLVFDATESFVESIDPSTFADVAGRRTPTARTIADTFSARVGGERGHHAQRRPGVLDLPARPAPHGRDRARASPRGPRRHDLVNGPAPCRRSKCAARRSVLRACL